MKNPNRGAGLRKNLMATRAQTDGHHKENQCWFCLPGKPKKYILEVEENEMKDFDGFYSDPLEEVQEFAERKAEFSDELFRLQEENDTLKAHLLDKHDCDSSLPMGVCPRDKVATGDSQ